MQNKQPWDRFFKNSDSQDLIDLRRDLLLEIGVGGIVVGWIVMVSAIGYNGNPLNLWIALVLFISSVGSIWLRNKSFPIALYLQIGGMLFATTLHKAIIADSWAQFFFPVSLVVSGLLVSNLSVFVVATLASLACLGVSHILNLPITDATQVGLPIILIYMTAFGSWLSSRQIHSVLGWMQSSYSQAREWLEQLRDERMAQARTIKILEEAYARIEKLNYLFLEARLAAEEARRLKAEFAANISHELRTPLNLIIGFSETMANAPETYEGARWTPTLRGDIEEIYRSSRHLLSLIDDILDLSALDVRRVGLTMQTASINDVVEEAAAVVRGLYQAKRLYLKIETQPNLPAILIDETRIRQVLINLLSNASRFTVTGGVTVRTTLRQNEILVAVIDTGSGIDPQSIPKVFEEFGQVDGSLSRAHEGTGLGVPLSKRLVELHGGQMWLESRVGIGTTFYFTLPKQAEKEPVPETNELPNPRPPALRTDIRKSILIAENDPLLMRSLRRQMSEYDLIEVCQAGALAELIEIHQPVALVVDTASLPDTQIMEDWLRSVPPDLPIIRTMFQGNLRVAQELGIQGYLLKPVSRNQLLDTIEGLPRPAHKILIADNDRQLTELFARMLESAGGVYETIQVENGVQALKILRERSIDLVLLDLMMPEMSGMEVLRVMKQDAALAETQVIMISGQYPEGWSSQTRCHSNCTGQIMPRWQKSPAASKLFWGPFHGSDSICFKSSKAF
jgi:signal transduction histidine kinase/DNA-binding response OmpR family regulator